MDLKIFLKNLPAFEEFGDLHLEAFVRGLEVREFADGHVFIRQGEQGEALFLILQGLVRVTRREAPGGDEREVRELGAGELFGVLSLVDDLPAAASCTANGAVKAASLTAESFRQLFDAALPIGRHLQYMIAVQLARDLRDENARIRALMASS